MRHLRTISIAAAFGMVFTLAPVTAGDDTAQATNGSPVTCLDMHGTGDPLTLEEPTPKGSGYEISNASQLVYLSENFDQFVSGTSGPQWREKDFVQTEPIDLGGCLFTPIGGSMGEGEERFTGKYISVSGSSITGLTINTVVEGAGLFGETSGAEISGVVLKDVQVNGTRSVGGLVGYARTTTISDSSVIG